jgi:predicted TIM-barrel fold metal-dependent hydrolase
MISGVPVVDVHQHLVRLDSLKMPTAAWAPPQVTGNAFEEIYGDDGVVVPDRYLAHLDQQGVDVALLMAEYSPRVTGMQSIEHMLPLAAADPSRVGVIAALNPHLHFPLVTELERQLDLGAVALKLHPVHGGYAPDRSDLYPVYARCEERRVPVVFHCGTSNFAGASNQYADPALLAGVIRDFPDLHIVLAHGGRGWFYDAAAWYALTYRNVWIELSGLPPHRLPDYYRGVGFARLAPRCIFGTDFPAIPGLRKNVEAVMGLGLDPAVLEQVMWRNAYEIYGLGRVAGMAERFSSAI